MNSRKRDNNYLGVPLTGRALRCNLFARTSQKGFPLQSLTQEGLFVIILISDCLIF